MSTRICVFKDCDNYYSRDENSDVTIFSFPKDPERAEQWRLLGQVHPNINSKQLFMCSKHFDRKYLSITKNRTILVGQAVPNAYEENAKSLITVENCNQNQGTSTTLCSSQSFYINLNDDELGDEDMIMIEASESKEIEEVKQVGVSIVPPSRKRAHSPSPSPPDSPDDCAEENDDEQLIDSSEVSIFKMRGEEYVQMSKDYYLQEKRKLMNQLRSYKLILSNFKTQLISLEDL